MNQQEFKIGDVVQLKSGGPTMTVANVSGDSGTVVCHWFDDHGQLKKATLVSESVKAYIPPKPSNLLEAL